ncbi:ADP-ribosylation/Crystallin J1 [Actinobacteria bacterium OK074]|nr:ADP-ribosylation/Crystallin J1 [Actinobacteria bacterium OK074]
MLRLTWVQPEDLVGHELRQAAQDGRCAASVERRWLAAGGCAAPERVGASPVPVSPELRVLAGVLLDELAEIPPAAGEPTELGGIAALCPAYEGVRLGSRENGFVGGCGSVVAGRAHAAVAAHSIQSRAPYGATLGRELKGPSAAVPESSAVIPRLHAAWLGRAVGCLLGKPVEKVSLAGIRAIAGSTANWPLNGYFTEVGLDPAVAAAHPWNRRSRPTSLVENIDGMPEDDDLNYPLLGLLLLQRYGHGFSTADVASLWLDELPAGRTFTAERVAYRNLLCGVEPPATATYRNPFREWIGAQIRADVYGWTNPGAPARAAELAHRDATLTHTANGVYGAVFVAAVVAHAAGPEPTTVHEALATGLRFVPPDSRYARAIRFGIDTARAEPTGTAAGFATVVDALHARYGRDHHWVHVLPNAALLAAALTHADGDFTGSICRAVSGGWDTDSNGASAGSIAGLLAGSPDAIDERWTAPLKNRLATTVAGFDGIGFDELARLTAESTA